MQYTNAPRLTKDQQTLLCKHLIGVSERPDLLNHAFMTTLLMRFPQAHGRFGRFSHMHQLQMVHEMLAGVYDSLEGGDWLITHLRAMAMRHDMWEISEAMYAQVTECFLTALAEVSGDQWGSELEAIWRQRLEWMNRVMLQATPDSVD